MIISWYGNFSDIPSGFLLCDGSNNTPDLRDRFIVGAGNSYALSDTGGEAYHTLTIAEMPAHTHNVYSISAGWTGDGFGNYSDYRFISLTSDNSNHRLQYNTMDYTGGNQPHNIRPPYYALYYIMKV